MVDREKAKKKEKKSTDRRTWKWNIHHCLLAVTGSFFSLVYRIQRELVTQNGSLRTVSSSDREQRTDGGQIDLVFHGASGWVQGNQSGEAFPGSPRRTYIAPGQTNRSEREPIRTAASLCTKSMYRRETSGWIFIKVCCATFAEYWRGRNGMKKKPRMQSALGGRIECQTKQLKKKSMNRYGSCCASRRHTCSGRV